MDVIILAAGNGSRMGDLTRNLPKPLVPINSVPIIDYVLKKLLFFDINRFIFVVGHQKNRLIRYLKENYSNEVELAFAFNNQVNRENGYSLLCAQHLISEDYFLVVMADHLVDTEIYEKVSEMTNKGEIILATDELPRLADPEEATKVLVEGNRILNIGKEIKEYSTYDTGVFLMSKVVFPVLEELTQIQNVVSISNLVNRCIRKGIQVSSCDVTGHFWIDLDTNQDIELFIQNLSKDEKDSGYFEIL